MIITCIVGFAVGAVVSVPLGGLGTIMIDRTMREGMWAGLSIGFMSAGTTALCCGISLQGIALLQTFPRVQVAVHGFGLALLMFVGVRTIVMPSRTVPPLLIGAYRQNPGANNPCAHHLQNLFLVMAYTFLNPTTCAFWTNMATVLHFTVLPPGDAHQNLIFSTGVGIGSAASQYVSLLLFHKAAERFPTIRTAVRRIAGVAFAATIICFSYSIGIEIVDLVRASA